MQMRFPLEKQAYKQISDYVPLELMLEVILEFWSEMSFEVEHDKTKS